MSTSLMKRRPNRKPAKPSRSAARRKFLPYKNPALSADKRVKDLLRRMTLEEKAAQMMCVWNEKATKLVDAQGNFDPEKAKASFKKGHGMGQVGRPSDAAGGINARRTAE